MRNRRYHPRPQRKSLFAEAPALFLGLVVAGVAGLYSIDDLASAPSQLFRLLDPSCNIKGNISINSGERIFHVPGQKYYAQTKINPQYGERWFCTEFEAWAAGWRKSKS
ncbi:sunset domain-containing protein [Rhizobium leguminosarum]|uniref:sunset domain-containing protein n=1 Tax=Rhizobium leguminosarum TaxID=384 RepID=UPI001440F5F9|nr:succinoglycan biosynthesis protein exoi [Rhizobium leguminosarum]NKL64985.1 succinoglycan biosynthesis protein exoi [Rhizobium leguminosarum bv. viciae]